ncbi:hypothetical protein GC093_22205 [Paenibacillus sp. LMG 31456]|uniref:Treble clef zinc finger domain-containing protein n=1 Tax=Paenibacillus foliorum TaxID=2654974 RepID=A0A972GS95_9BACL|nr:hypothetical protein [Paenibacillus foliorum]NOU95914.1 hypothetical protein [Paenibacillus foliorum]
MTKKQTIEDMHKLAEVRGGRCLSDKYINSQTKLTWECADGHTWDAVPAKVKFSSWCRVCAGGEKSTIVQMRELAQAKGGKCLSQHYINTGTKLKWLCSKGHVFERAPVAIKSGKWCSKCSIQQRAISARAGIEEMQQLAEARGGRCLSTDYTNAHTELEWECHNGHRWPAKPNSIKNGSWCPTCRLTTEDKCRIIIQELTGQAFIKNKRVIKPYELDGYNETLKLAFEYHGIQHYQFLEHFHKFYGQFLERQERKKEAMCAAIGIRLIAIPYTAAHSDDELIRFTRQHLKLLGVPLVTNKVNLSSFYEGLKPLNKLRELARKHGGECLATSYINNKTPVPWRCKFGHEWNAKPNDITSSQWCGKCAGNQPLTIADMHETARQRNGLCLSNEYINSQTHLLWQCEQGHTWKATASDVRSGRWCKKCSTKRRSEARKDTIEEMHELARQRGGECLTDVYVNSQTHLIWRCGRGHEWPAKPNNIKNGTWCPRCKNRKK